MARSLKIPIASNTDLQGVPVEVTYVGKVRGVQLAHSGHGSWMLAEPIWNLARGHRTTEQVSLS
jgi:hypothetical protein